MCLFKEEILRVLIENGTSLVISPNGGAEPESVVRADLGQQLLAAGWHHLSMQRDAQTLRAQVDDAAQEHRAVPIEDADLLVG